MLASRLLFQGHDTFLCRTSWLKKGYDFIERGRGFTDADAVVQLGVGKNMVTAIRYWLRAFGLTDDADTLLPVAHELLGAHGLDPYRGRGYELVPALSAGAHRPRFALPLRVQ